ncbi:hypothetical protein [Brevibacterium litoralis]|uniref:hypothetical protein n=1 Tax=Brevibacterium litoralis TaxID=3138935 RepID=UPI0032EC46BE
MATATFTPESVRAAVHLVYGRLHSDDAPPADGSGITDQADLAVQVDVTAKFDVTAQVDSVLAAVTSDFLAGIGLSHAEVRAAISRSLTLVATGRAQTLSAAAYDRGRAEVLDGGSGASGAGSTSRAGSRVWPPTSQTVRKVLGGGYWNEAMDAVGYSAGASGAGNAGRARGSGRFSPEDYRAVMRTFLAHVEEAGGSASFAAFTAWAKEENTAGRRHPSGAAVRNHFGSWEDAKASAE